MVHYTVLVPARDATDAVGRLLPSLRRALEPLLLPFEIICIDDASTEPHLGMLEELLPQHAELRVLQFDRPRGTSAALTAGIAAARGELILGVSPHTRLDVCHVVPHLIARLSQHDLVIAAEEQTRAAELLGFFPRLARVLAAESQLHPSEDLLFAARREAVTGLALSRGTFRVLPDLLATHGYRVCRLTVAPGLPIQGADVRPGRWGRATVGWLDRRFEPHLARELSPFSMATPRTTLSHVAPRKRFASPPPVTPAQTEHRESA